MNVEIGRAIRLLRLQRGYSQNEIAKILGIHRPAYTLVEQGRQKLTAEQLFLLSWFYAVPMFEMEEMVLCRNHRSSGLK